jgi:hypothetical protein
MAKCYRIAARNSIIFTRVSAFCLPHFGDASPNFLGLGVSRVHDGLSMLGRRVAVHVRRQSIFPVSGADDSLAGQPDEPRVARNVSGRVPKLRFHCGPANGRSRRTLVVRRILAGLRIVAPPRAKTPEWNLRWPYAPAVRSRNGIAA